MATQNALLAAGQDTVKTITVDMSSSWRSPAFDLNANGGVSSFSIEAAWPSTGTPVGAYTLETSNNPEATTGHPMDITAEAAFVAQQPGGASDTGSFMYRDVPASTAVAWVVYTKASGGTGCVGTVRINFKAKV